MCHKSLLFLSSTGSLYICYVALLMVILIKEEHSLFLSVCVQDTQTDAGIHTTIRRLMHAYYYYDQVKASNALGIRLTPMIICPVRWMIALLELLNVLIE